MWIPLEQVCMLFYCSVTSLCIIKITEFHGTLRRCENFIDCYSKIYRYQKLLITSVKFTILDKDRDYLKTLSSPHPALIRYSACWEAYWRNSTQNFTELYPSENRTNTSSYSLHLSEIEEKNVLYVLFLYRFIRSITLQLQQYP